jgi:hypothetical protein
MRTLPIALVVIATGLAPSAQAIVGIYAGTENQTTSETYSGAPHGFSRENRVSGRVYFLYDFETTRSVEIRIHGKQYRVRAERDLVDQTFVRTIKNIGNYTWVLSDAGKNAVPAGTKNLFNVSWRGTKAWSGAGPAVDPKSGLMGEYPTAFTGRQDIVTKSIDLDSAVYSVLTRRVAPVSLSAPITKACNDANENFDQALVRLKAKLDAAGYTESTSAGDFLN